MESPALYLFKHQQVKILDVIAEYEKENIQVAKWISDDFDLVEKKINETMNTIEQSGNVIFDWGNMETSKKFVYYFKYGSPFEPELRDN